MPHRCSYVALCKYVVYHPQHLYIGFEWIHPATGPSNCTAPLSKNLTTLKLLKLNNAAVISNQCTAAGTVQSGGRNCTDLQNCGKREGMLLRSGRQAGIEGGFLLCCTIIIQSPPDHLSSHSCRWLFSPTITTVTTIASLQVQSGGSFDIDYVVTSPTQKVILDGSKERQGDFVFTANEIGEYKFCLDNDMSTFAEKLVDFEIAVSTRPTNSHPLAVPCCSADFFTTLSLHYEFD